MKVRAQDTPETSQHLNYPVPIKNIWPEKTVFIQCSLTEIVQSCELWEIWNNSILTIASVNMIVFLLDQGAISQATAHDTRTQGMNQGIDGYSIL